MSSGRLFDERQADAGTERDGGVGVDAPLAERMRPRSLTEVLGQSHVLGADGVLTAMVRAKRLVSTILWGPPGVGKTTLARLLAQDVGAHFEPLSATSAGVKDLRDAIDRASARRGSGPPPVLFVDEIHRFSRSQQDALLPDVERGRCVLVGATTENPAIAIIAALTSRVRVVRLRALDSDALAEILDRALHDETRGLGRHRVGVPRDALAQLGRACEGDARRALNVLELAVVAAPGQSTLTPEDLSRALGARVLRHDRDRKAHADVTSAFIKSMRGSDPDAAVYWMWRMLDAGEDPLFVARRLCIFASEDVGNADPSALSLCDAAAASVQRVGMPEAGYALTQATLYLALALKSDAVGKAMHAARAAIQRHGSQPVPEWLTLRVERADDHGRSPGPLARERSRPHAHPGHIDPDGPGGLPRALAQAWRGVIAGASEHGWEARAWSRLAAYRQIERTPSAPLSRLTTDCYDAAVTHLSVNVNKVATLRNSRGGDVPSLAHAVDVIVGAGAPGITVHPRDDERHIRRADVDAIAQQLRTRYPHVEYNIEGDPREALLAMIEAVRPAQVTLVPVRPGEVTSEAGWDVRGDATRLGAAIARVKTAGCRCSVFVDADLAAIAWAASLGADRVELFTEPWARAFEAGGDARARALDRFAAAAARADELGMGVNAGHDLDLGNLPDFLARVRPLHEVSIGHALLSRALFVGLAHVVREHLAILARPAGVTA